LVSTLVPLNKLWQLIRQESVQCSRWIWIQIRLRSTGRNWLDRLVNPRLNQYPVNLRLPRVDHNHQLSTNRQPTDSNLKPPSSGRDGQFWLESKGWIWV
jgi:hypothetical protein